jgi:hypothetical protein
MMRPFNYARTAPEAREGFPVFVVGFAVVIIGAGTYGDSEVASTPFGRIIGVNEVEAEVPVTR